MLRHDWVFDVLTDLAVYAEANGLTELARKAREALDVAREEVAEMPDAPEGPAEGDPGEGGSQMH